MRNDLLYAQAAIDWAVSNFPSFNQRLNAWVEANVRIGIEELDSQHTHDLLIAGEQEFLPLHFSVEAGAYINTIRSALDMLAVTLAHRHGIAKPDDMHFPIVTAGEAIFKSRNGFNGDKLINGLPDAERKIIESLRPYKGGNELIFALHRLDIMRKHQRLLTVEIIPAHLSIAAADARQHFTPISGPGYVRSTDKTILGLWRKGIPKPKVELTAFVAINEVDLVHHKPVIAVLDQFASHTASIIKLFDY